MVLTQTVQLNETLFDVYNTCNEVWRFTLLQNFTIKNANIVYNSEPHEKDDV